MPQSSAPPSLSPDLKPEAGENVLPQLSRVGAGFGRPYADGRRSRRDRSEETMTSAPSLPFPLPFFRRGKKRSTTAPVSEAVLAAGSPLQVPPIEIVAPDQLSAALL